MTVEIRLKNNHEELRRVVSWIEGSYGRSAVLTSQPSPCFVVEKEE